MDCEKLSTCAFFKEYERDDSKRLALNGLASLYCKGNRQSDCVRKKISEVLGSSDKVPVNMMPNGQPLAGTDTSDWSKEVREAMG